MRPPDVPLQFWYFFCSAAVAYGVRTLAGEQMRENVGFAHDTLEHFVSALESMRDDIERVGGGEPVCRGP
jgi:hypothetical protein